MLKCTFSSSYPICPLVNIAVVVVFVVIVIVAAVVVVVFVSVVHARSLDRDGTK